MSEATANRRGSVVLLCLAVVTALLLIAFAYVRVAALQHETNASENRMLLARQAALMGRDHAIEQILRDFVNGPFNRMDDSAHAAFVSLDRPYESDYATDTAVQPQFLNVDNVPAENNLVQSFGGPYNDWNSLANQQHIYDGRGRYYEPGFYNLAVAGFDPAATQPTAPVRFGTTWTLSDPPPDRSGGIFYDAHLKRITGDPRTARTESRYRLRYAVGVIDLDGEILVNGDQGVDYATLNGAGPLDSDPDPAHVLTAGERVLRWKNALPQIVFTSSTYGNLQYGWGAGVSGGARAEHVFMGRGATTNFAIDPVTRAPVTFPYMFRNGSIQRFKNVAGNGPADTLYRTQVLGGDAIPNDQSLVHALLGAQFSFNNYDAAINGVALDDSDGKADALGRFTPFGRGLALGATGRWSGHVDTPWCVNLMTAPAGVIYGMLAGYMPPGAISVYWHENTPTVGVPDQDWVGNSYSRQLIGCRDLFVKEFSPAFGPSWGDYTTPSRASPAVSIDYTVADTRTPSQRYPGIIGLNGLDGATWVSDDLGRYLRAVVKPVAVSTAGGEIDDSGRPEVVRANGQKHYKETRILPNPAQPRTELSYWEHEDRLLGTGANKTGSPVPVPADWSSTVSYAIGDLAYHQGGTYRALTANLNKPPAWSGSDWKALAPGDYGYNSGIVGAAPDSIWDVLGNAMAATIVVARGQYFQYPSLNTSAATYFGGAAWSGTRVATIKDIDALFVANLGSSITHPNDPTPVSGWQASGNQLAALVPSYNLAGLRTATTSVEVLATAVASGYPARIDALGSPPQVKLRTTPLPAPAVYTWPIMARNHADEPRYDSAKPTYSADDRTAIIELIINDMRLSFFGSSPGYGDDFRALDLNGDGKAHCSGFHSLGGGPLGQYTTAVDGNGVATVPVERYFSTTGVFFLGRSRFWRIMVRGEVWDNVLQSAVDCAQLDSVLCVDPANEAREWVSGGTPDPAKGQYATHLLYQRWFYNVYRGLMPRQQ